ncbi:hypothetical protein ACRRTK_014126 [Alexandromys fortis]
MESCCGAPSSSWKLQRLLQASRCSRSLHSLKMSIFLQRQEQNPAPTLFLTTCMLITSVDELSFLFLKRFLFFNLNLH